MFKLRAEHDSLPLTQKYLSYWYGEANDNIQFYLLKETGSAELAAISMHGTVSWGIVSHSLFDIRHVNSKDRLRSRGEQILPQYNVNL